MCKLYNMTYKIVDNKPENGLFLQLSDDKYILFESSNQDAVILINSMKEMSLIPSSTQINSKEFYVESLISQTGNRNSLFQIDYCNPFYFSTTSCAFL